MAPKANDAPKVAGIFDMPSAAIPKVAGTFDTPSAAIPKVAGIFDVPSAAIPKVADTFNIPYAAPASDFCQSNILINANVQPAPAGAKSISPRRKPWVEHSQHRFQAPVGATRTGCRPCRGYFTIRAVSHGSRHGLIAAAPAGVNAVPIETNTMTHWITPMAHWTTATAA